MGIQKEFEKEIDSRFCIERIMNASTAESEPENGSTEEMGE